MPTPDNNQATRALPERGLRHLLAGHRGLVALAGLGLLIDVAVNSTLPLLYMEMFDVALPAQDGNYLRLLIVLVALAIGVQFTGWLARAAAVSRLAARIPSGLQQRMFDHLQRLALHTDASTGARLALFTEHTRTIESVFLTTAPRAIFGALLGTAGIALMFSIDWSLALVTVAVFPLTLAGSRLLGKRLRRASDARQRASDRFSATLHDGLILQAAIRAFSLQAHWRDRVAAQGNAVEHTGTRLGFTQVLAQALTMIGVATLMAVVISGGAFLALHGTIGVGALLGFFALLLNVAAGVRHVVESLPELDRARASLRSIDEFLDTRPGHEDPGSHDAIGPLTGSLGLDQVTFRYHDQSRPALDRVSLIIERGTRAAIVGPSGSGKSTLASLLLGFHCPDSGHITWNGQKIPCASMASLRRHIGVVFQDTSLFDLSVRDNIRLGKLDASDHEIEAAAQAAGVHQAIMTWPDGYDTRVGERGQRLSVGQRQRVAIARAMVRQPDVLLLDEATSALDPETAAAIQETLDQLSHDRTVIEITHRFTSAASFQRIFVLNQGVLVEQGTHESLIAAGGVYARLGGFDP